MPDQLDDLKNRIVLAHRILMMTGSMGDITGHVFVRVPGTNELLVRCRNDQDWSPGFMTPGSLHRFDLDGNPTEDLAEWTPPPERHIGCSIFKARPEVTAVVHGHPQAQIMCGIADVPIRAIVNTAVVGGMNIGVGGGVPVYPRSILIASPEAGQDVLSAMGSGDYVLLKHHGNVVCARSLDDALQRSIRIEETARLCWQMAVAGVKPPTIPWEDLEEYNHPKQPAAQFIQNRGGPGWVWSYYQRVLQEGGKPYADFDLTS